ncbi:hypothetical protein PoB_000532900 [Plakobranchus ocellatus]|uniref:Uncharacterized protein n=1 Tax=Plakobranchus ocellatus TaxID=259542 RepID=A0AAV3Y7C2_9GAST|nr:hypothetical protein PoB_000532900 [Plakobranchus ocellatus]
MKHIPGYLKTRPGRSRIQAGEAQEPGLAIDIAGAPKTYIFIVAFKSDVIINFSSNEPIVKTTVFYSSQGGDPESLRSTKTRGKFVVSTA